MLDSGTTWHITSLNEKVLNSKATNVLITLAEQLESTATTHRVREVTGKWKKERLRSSSRIPSSSWICRWVSFHYCHWWTGIVWSYLYPARQFSSISSIKSQSCVIKHKEKMDYSTSMTFRSLFENLIRNQYCSTRLWCLLWREKLNQNPPSRQLNQSSSKQRYGIFDLEMLNQHKLFSNLSEIITYRTQNV